MADSDDHSSSGSSDDTLEPLQDEVGLPENRRQLIHRQSSSMRLHLGGSTRTSWVPDLQTGTTGKRECRAYAISTTPRGRSNWSMLVQNTSRRNSPRQQEPDEEEEVDDSGTMLSQHHHLSVRRKEGNQYRLTSSRPAPTSPWQQLQKFLGLTQNTIYDDHVCSSSQKMPLLVRYFHWAFRSPFATVILSGALVYLLLAFIFALLLYLLGHRHPTCIENWNKGSFMDAFTLSWTTFSTVGYGIVYSGISTDEPKQHLCTGITIVVTVEAFVGVLFASMCGAIVFAKISRVQSFAQVAFSDALVIRYGSGVLVEHGDEEEDKSPRNGDEEEALPDDEPSRMPCPILEFRLANRLQGVKGGEIIDGSVNVVASIDAAQACSSIRTGTRRRRGKKGKGRRRSAKLRRQESDEAVQKKKTSRQAIDAFILETQMRKNQEFDEDPTGHLVPRRIFSKLEVESMDHPFFKRVWTVRHVLDKNSPLLRSEARKLVKDNDGMWPRELNSPDGVRASIYFDHILVSMSGTSNADANSVYATKSYGYKDVHIGYRFVNMLYRKGDDHMGALRADMTLLNDVVEQAGGGGEYLGRFRMEPSDRRASTRTFSWVI